MKYSQTKKLKQPLKGFQPSPCHWTRKGKGHWKQKVAYDTEDEAEEFLKQNPKLIRQGYKSYLCQICSKWHVGRSVTYE